VARVEHAEAVVRKTVFVVAAKFFDCLASIAGLAFSRIGATAILNRRTPREMGLVSTELIECLASLAGLAVRFNCLTAVGSRAIGVDKTLRVVVLVAGRMSDALRMELTHVSGGLILHGNTVVLVKAMRLAIVDGVDVGVAAVGAVSPVLGPTIALESLELVAGPGRGEATTRSH